MKIQTTHQHEIRLTRDEIEAAIRAYIGPKLGERVNRLESLRMLGDNGYPDEAVVLVDQKDVVSHPTNKQG